MDTKDRGFAHMSPERRREIARMGGLAAQASGKAHKWKAGEEAKSAGSKGGSSLKRTRRLSAPWLHSGSS